ncbi:hypothetical protein SLEP1_g58029 [Rubroshorea leprosula]|uniref:Uncharacterized protein n=1 Tax=Rubroshorea leprosula TaxID=152421 RepID=A0AAV5MPA7_9ROSI|nr:hypothetical protein SLEP1_g58029 [Rubroshorea leprosula]
MGSVAFHAVWQFLSEECCVWKRGWNATDENYRLQLEEIPVDGEGRGVVGFWDMVGTMLTRRRSYVLVMEKTLASVWRPIRGMHVQDGPWHFDKNMVVTWEVMGDEVPRRDMLGRIPFWIIYGGSSCHLSAATARMIRYL